MHKKNLKKSKSDSLNQVKDGINLKNSKTLKISNKNIQYILSSFDAMKDIEEKISLQNFELGTLVILFKNLKWIKILLKINEMKKKFDDIDKK